MKNKRKPSTARQPARQVERLVVLLARWRAELAIIEARRIRTKEVADQSLMLLLERHIEEVEQVLGRAGKKDNVRISNDAP